MVKLIRWLEKIGVEVHREDENLWTVIVDKRRDSKGKVLKTILRQDGIIDGDGNCIEVHKESDNESNESVLLTICI